MGLFERKTATLEAEKFSGMLHEREILFMSVCRAEIEWHIIEPLEKFCAESEKISEKKMRADVTRSFAIIFTF